MKTILVIAHREYAAMVATKAFLFTLIMMPILMFGGIVLMPQLNKLSGGKERKIVVADGTGVLFEKIKSASEQRNAALAAAKLAAEKSAENGDKPEKAMVQFGGASDDRFAQSDSFVFSAAEAKEFTDGERLKLSDQIRSGEIYAFVDIPADMIEPKEPNRLPKIDFVSQDAAISDARQWLSGIMQAELRTIRLDKLGVDPSLVAQADIPVIVAPASLYKESKDGSVSTKQDSNPLLTIFLPFGVMMLMFMVIFLAAQPMLESGMEEKSQRIAELLLGSVTPTQLMTGKLIGNVCGSLMIFAIYGIGGWVILDTNGWSDALPWELMPWFLVFQILGVLFYSSIFLTVGASISDLKEAQSLLLPIWMFIMLPMMVWFVVIRDPNGIVPVALSFFPPSTSMMMILRMATGQAIPAWQPPVAAVLLLIGTCVVVSIAGKLYRISLLRNDPVRSMVQLFKRLGQSG